VICAICSQDLYQLSVDHRQAHYDRHFGEELSSPNSPGPSKPKSRRFSPNKLFSSAKWQLKENDVFWYPTKRQRIPKNFVPGLIPVLKRALLKSHARGETRKAALCYDQAVLIRQEKWDMGWGCGYRNFLMACACLMVQPFQPMYFPLLDSPTTPSIRNLQTWIEDAWGKGFDREGQKQLKTLVGTRRWIGTADLYVAFSSRGIPSQLFDFTDVSNAQIVMDWIVNYFTPQVPGTLKNAFEELKSATPVTCTEKMPLILQHAGHSRTIVGYEITKQGIVNLLQFESGMIISGELQQLALSQHPQAEASPADDEVEIVSETLQIPDSDDEIIITGYKPSKRVNKPTNASSLDSKTFDHQAIIRPFRLGTKKLGTKNQYQILAFPLTDPLSEKDMQRCKVVKSTKIC
ncbi:hypothetical protein FA15DRAFT_591235, partial [Coprinopsis marcescibilis]